MLACIAQCHSTITNNGWRKRNNIVVIIDNRIAGSCMTARRVLGARWLIHGYMYFCPDKPRRSEGKWRTLMAGRAALPIFDSKVGLRRVAAQNHGLCNHRACPHCLDCMTHVAKLGGKKTWSRASHSVCRSGLPTCLLMLMARKTPTAVTKQGRRSSPAVPLKSQAFGTLNLTAGTPGAIGNSKSATCLEKCYNGRRSWRRREFSWGLCLREEIRAEVGACVRVCQYGLCLPAEMI